MFKSKQNIAILGLVLLLSSVFYFQGGQHTTITATKRLLPAYTTTTTRSASVNNFCTGKTRATLTDSSANSAYNLYKKQMQAMFTLDGNSLFNNLFSGKTDSSTSQLQSNAIQVVGFIGPFILGLVLLLILSPFLLCCCTCPHCCPVKCCQKSEEEQYTKFQLYWPTVILIFALLLCIGACVAGFSQSKLISSSLDNMTCASSIVLDDLMNGNVTADGSSFFAGLSQIKTQLGYLNGNLTAINSTMSNIASNSTNMTRVQNDATAALAAIARIPNNVNAGGDMNTITYNTPFNSATITGNITSIFPPILGSSTTGGHVGFLYTFVNATKASISSIAISADNFLQQSANFSSGVAALQTTIADFNNFVSIADIGSYTFIDNLSSKRPTINLGVQLVYGITISFASLMLLGTLLVAFCDKPKCRYLMYFACAILFLIGLMGFLMTIIFSILTPTVYFGCQFIDYSLNSTDNFNSNFQNIISNANFRNYMTACLPTSNGDLMTAFGGDAISAITNLSTSISSMNSFNITYQASMILSGMTQITSWINNYQTAVVLDITDPPSISILSGLSKPSQYPTCTATGFTSDSWIPSNNQNPSYIDCQIPGGSLSSCGSSISSRAGSCNGCMDTTAALNSYSSQATLLTNLGTRYPGCTTFNNDLANTWNNYYKLKKAAYGPIVTRASSANTAINTLSTDLTGSLNTTFTNAKASLAAASATVTDPDYGLVAGLNCKLIGQDIQMATTTFCQSVFTISYFTRLVLGLASFGILFSLCCGVCTGVRFYKHDIRKLNSANNQGISDREVKDITNTNFVKPKALQ